MPRAFGFDGDSAYHESLREGVLADEAKKKAATDEAAKERRKSLGLPEEEHGKRPKDPERKKSFGEKAANFLFNGGRTLKVQKKQEEKIGGVRDHQTQQNANHGSPEIMEESHRTPDVIR